LAYDAQKHAYVLPQNQLLPSEIDETLLNPSLTNNVEIHFTKIPQRAFQSSEELPASTDKWFPMTVLSPEQMERIYRGSATK
jgi:carbonic anhydrase